MVVSNLHIGLGRIFVWHSDFKFCGTRGSACAGRCTQNWFPLKNHHGLTRLRLLTSSACAHDLAKVRSNTVLKTVFNMASVARKCGLLRAPSSFSELQSSSPFCWKWVVGSLESHRPHLRTFLNWSILKYTYTIYNNVAGLKPFLDFCVTGPDLNTTGPDLKPLWHLSIPDDCDSLPVIGPAGWTSHLPQSLTPTSQTLNLNPKSWILNPSS
jgi:hypothetical protein